MRRKIGVLGGTFDPIHHGHLAAAEEARVKLGLDKVLFVVASIPPHKQNEPVTPAPHRLAMVELALASNPYFEISRIDMERPGPSYTVDTVSLLQKELGTEVEIYFIMGLDSLWQLPTWKDPQRLIQLSRLVAVNRPGYEVDLGELEEKVPGISQRTQIMATPEVDVSASDLQERVRDGLPIKYQVPPAVEEYIYAHNLYR